MKRIFLSVPMKGRTIEDIKFTIEKMKQVLTAMCGCEYIEFVDNLINDDDTKQLVKEATRDNGEVKQVSLVYLGEAVKKMASCDYIAVVHSRVFSRLDDSFKGCQVERLVAENYDIKWISITDPEGDLFFPDLLNRAEELEKQFGTGRYRCKSEN